MIQLDRVTKSFPGHRETICVLREISLAVNRGEFVAIVGPSGAGKTTLMNLAGCLARPTTGTVSIDGRDTSALSDAEISHLRNERIGFVFQMFHLLGRLNALENVLLPLLYSRACPPDADARAMRLLELVGLAPLARSSVSTMSGGQQQRVAIARALINSPDLIIADEPTGNLDPDSAQGVLKLLQELNCGGKTILLITHDSGVAAIAGRVVALEGGRVVLDSLRDSSRDPAS